jgi:hypothetical protein
VVVYKPEGRQLGRFVALKFLPDEIARDSQLWNGSSAKPARRLPRMTLKSAIYEIGKQDDESFIAM